MKSWMCDRIYAGTREYKKQLFPNCFQLYFSHRNGSQEYQNCCKIFQGHLGVSQPSFIKMRNVYEDASQTGDQEEVPQLIQLFEIAQSL